MLLASIDIGSNAVRLLFANAYEHNGRTLVEKATLVRIPVRLGMDVFKYNRITPDRKAILIKTLKAFKYLIDVYKPVDYCAYATAAMRETTNNEKVLSKIKKKTGLNVKLIDGIEEANIIKDLNEVYDNDLHSVKMYIDVGGGSTEITIIENKKIISSKSFKIGTIRLLENNVDKNEWEKLKEWLDDHNESFGKFFCVGTGGNINKIGKLYTDRLKNIISYEKLNEISEYLNGFTIEQRINELGMRPDRADVIIPALKIYLFIMNHAKINSMFIPGIGLADGLIYKLYKEITSK